VGVLEECIVRKLLALAFSSSLVCFGGSGMPSSCHRAAGQALPLWLGLGLDMNESCLNFHLSTCGTKNS
jgi:hypothetical protein